MSKRLFKFGKGKEVQNTKNKSEKTEFTKNYIPYMKAYLQETGKAVWMPRNYEKFSDEAYSKNAVAYRSINLIAQSIASIKWQLFAEDDGISKELKSHPALNLLHRPNPCRSGFEFLEALISYKLINGNAYILKIGGLNEQPQELHLLRPDRVSVIAGKGGIPAAYQYKIGDDEIIYPVDPISGKSAVLHIKYFHPLNDWYGLSPIEAAANSIDQNNNAGTWNQSLLQNGAKPSGALVVKTAEDGSGGALSDDQFDRIKNQIDEQFSGAANAGRPLLLEGGLDWKEMSLSPKDMDFIETKYSSARDIALTFGVPPQMLGIPGDNTYNNLAEARFAMWEQTILPLADQVIDSLNYWLLPQYGKNIRLSYKIDEISALSAKRDKVWDRIQNADFMTVNEKRQAVGLDTIEGGNQ